MDLDSMVRPSWVKTWRGAEFESSFVKNPRFVHKMDPTTWPSWWIGSTGNNSLKNFVTAGPGPEQIRNFPESRQQPDKYFVGATMASILFAQVASNATKIFGKGVGGGLHSTEGAYLLLTQQPQVWIPAFLKFFRGKMINFAEVNQRL